MMTSGTTTAPLPEPTLQQLRIAFQNLARPVLWPDTLEQAMEVPHWRIALTHAARNVNRPAWSAHTAHSLPRPPAPPTPGPRELTGVLAHGRSPYSIATGPMTELTSWRGSSPKQMMTRPRNTTCGTHDCKRAAANDKE